MIRFSLVPIALASLSTVLAPAGAPAGDAGTIAGKVTFTGTAPKMPPINFEADPVCTGAHAGTKVVKEEFVQNANGTLKNVLVFVKSSSKALEGKKFDAPKEAVVLDQSGCMYKPHVFGVMVGQEIKVRNSDETSHNIKCTPKKNTAFNFSQAKKGMEDAKTFDKEEVSPPVRVECNVHPWMNGHVGVFSHPFFAVTGDDGTYSIANLPPGEYELVAWHESGKLDGTKTQAVTVAAGESKAVDFDFKPKAKE